MLPAGCMNKHVSLNNSFNHFIILSISFLVLSPLPAYLVREGGVDLLLQPFHGIRVCCQIVSQESERAAAGFIASKEENHCLRKDLMII